MERSDVDLLAAVEADALGQLATSGQAILSAEALSAAVGARCHEEVRVWVENLCRCHHLTAEEDPTQQSFTVRHKGIL